MSHLAQKLEEMGSELSVLMERAPDMKPEFRDEVKRLEEKDYQLKQKVAAIVQEDKTTEQLAEFPKVKSMEEALEDGLSLDAIRLNLENAIADIRARKVVLSGMPDVFKANGRKFSALHRDIKSVEQGMSKLPKPQSLPPVRKEMMDEMRKGVELHELTDKSQHKDAPNLNISLYLKDKAEKILRENPKIHETPEFDRLMQSLVRSKFSKRLTQQELLRQVNKITPSEFHELIIDTAAAIKAKQFESPAIKLVDNLGNIAKDTVHEFAELAKHESRHKTENSVAVDRIKHTIASKLINAIEDAGFNKVKINKSNLEEKLEVICKEVQKQKSERSTFIKLKDATLSIFGTQSRESIAIERAAKAKLAQYVMKEISEVAHPSKKTDKKFVKRHVEGIKRSSSDVSPAS